MKSVPFQSIQTLAKTALFLLVQCLFLSSCEVQPPEPGTDPPTESYAVTGTVVDTKGAPMAGVKVRADNSALYGSTEVTTDQQGRYKLPKLEIGSWKVYAWKEVNYKGKTYHLRLGMPAAADYDAVSPGKDGVVKNFRWQLSGQIPDRPRSERSGSGYFGGTLLFRNLGPDASTMAAGTVVTITLTPVAGATLFDGSAPTIIKKSFTIEAGEYNYWVHDIAQCEYRITAEAKLNGAGRQIQLSKSVSSGHAAAIEGFYFKPHLGSSGDYENGLLTTNDDPFFIY
ncbi:carboxypeptidase-like regulatory domain-containing protein [Telluribacter sp.]|jgi:hypothetical protein|uniref:carboxypeptidase-like regulatory domain-containing protein n=1 Tax=Telluribacter sp. TaxID=1978767 RepID=UPI002E0F83C7|nr:carboxypeptidase-like regulatory domain-containing protein [Telluribacter sp.]